MAIYPTNYNPSLSLILSRLFFRHCGQPVPCLKYKRLIWSVGFLSPDTDYADYTTDSAFGRAAPNGRGHTDEKRGVHLDLTISSRIFEVCPFWGLDFLYYLRCRDHWERLGQRPNLRHNLRNLCLGRENPLTKSTVYISKKPMRLRLKHSDENTLQMVNWKAFSSKEGE